MEIDRATIDRGREQLEGGDRQQRGGCIADSGREQLGGGCLQQRSGREQLGGVGWNGSSGGVGSQRPGAVIGEK